MPTMLAARLHYATGGFGLEEIPVPVPAPGQVRIKVEAAGICLSDIHAIDGTLSLDPPVESVTLGHEVAGVIDAVGDAVPDEWRPGLRVLLQAGQSCGACRECLRGIGACRSPRTRGLDFDGGWAEYTLAEHRTLVAVPDGLPPEQAAVIPDAVSTPWAAITATARVRPAQSAGVWGLGGLGAHSVQLLRLTGAAPIIGVDPLPEARERALVLGADHALDPADPGFADRVLALTGGHGLDVAFDMAGAAPVWEQAHSVLARDGRLVLVGLTPQPLALAGSTRFSVLRQQVRGHFGSVSAHLDELVTLVRHGRLDLSRSISDVLPLSDVVRGVERLTRKEGNPIRLVLKP